MNIKLYLTCIAMIVVGSWLSTILPSIGGPLIAFGALMLVLLIVGRLLLKYTVVGRIATLSSSAFEFIVSIFQTPEPEPEPKK